MLWSFQVLMEQNVPWTAGCIVIRLGGYVEAEHQKPWN